MATTKQIISKYAKHTITIERADWSIDFYDYETSRHYTRRVWFSTPGSDIYVQLHGKFYSIVTESEGRYAPWACCEYSEVEEPETTEPENKVQYNGQELTVRGGAWADEMNSCMYTVIDTVAIPGFIICSENGSGELFALRGTMAADVEPVSDGTKTVSRTNGTLYGGVAYEREIITYTRSDGRKNRHTVTDYRKGDREARVIEHGGYCSIGRENAEMFQTKPTMGRTRTYKHVENARAKAVELVLRK